MNASGSMMMAVLLGVGVAVAGAQKPAAGSKVAEMQKTVRGLKWQDVDYEGVSLLERCRTLMLLNHSLDEIGAVVIAEADLMSEFVEIQKLGKEAASGPPADTGLARNYEDARKVAVALLQGPMSDSRYTSELAGTDESGLKAYEKLYDKTCRGKWSKFVESRKYVQTTAAFLKGKDKIKDYMAWVDTESERRQQEHEKKMAERRSATKARGKEKRDQQQARKEEIARQQEAEAEQSRQAQEALYASMQSGTAAPAGTVVVDDDDDDGWLLGYGIARRGRRRDWHRDSAYQNRARERTNVRVNRGGRSGGRRR